MIKNVLTCIGGVEAYGVISLCLFFLVFGVALIRALALKKPYLNSMSLLPLEDEAQPASKSGDNRHE